MIIKVRVFAPGLTFLIALSELLPGENQTPFDCEPHNDDNDDNDDDNGDDDSDDDDDAEDEVFESEIFL